MRPVVNWKAECERALALMLKFPEQSMFNRPENLYLRVSVTSMDYCDGILLCCKYASEYVNKQRVGDVILLSLFSVGEARSNFTTKKIYAYLYQFSKHSWKPVTTFPVPGLPISITFSCLVSGFKIFAGRNDGNLFVWNLEIDSRQVSSHLHPSF